MDLKLSGLHVVVTGASFGTGSSVVQKFLEEGAHVYFCARTQSGINKFLTSTNNHPNLFGKALDVTDIYAFDQWLTEIKHVDVFIPNVSALSDNWNKSIEIDLNSTIKSVELIIPYLKQSKQAAITYIGSVASSFANSHVMPSYGATKLAITYYMKTLSKNLIKDNIRVNTVSPGHTFASGGFWDRIKQNNPKIYQDAINSGPMGRMATGEEIANVVTFISSPIASFVNGANWIVDGNLTDHIQN